MKEVNSPTLEQLKEAHRLYQSSIYQADIEAYEVAIATARSATVEQDQGKLADAVALLLRKWNRQYYRFRGGFKAQDLLDIQELIQGYFTDLEQFTHRDIGSLTETDFGLVDRIYCGFEQVLGPVGAAKALHVVAPRCFPPWDRVIAAAYGISLGGRGANGPAYRDFVEQLAAQCHALRFRWTGDGNLLKYIDEYNICHYRDGTL